MLHRTKAIVSVELGQFKGLRPTDKLF
jgi:hypothetical protein